MLAGSAATLRLGTVRSRWVGIRCVMGLRVFYLGGVTGQRDGSGGVVAVSSLVRGEPVHRENREDQPEEGREQQHAASFLARGHDSRP